MRNFAAPNHRLMKNEELFMGHFLFFYYFIAIRYLISVCSSRGICGMAHRCAGSFKHNRHDSAYALIADGDYKTSLCGKTCQLLSPQPRIFLCAGGYRPDELFGYHSGSMASDHWSLDC